MPAPRVIHKDVSGAVLLVLPLSAEVLAVARFCK